MSSLTSATRSFHLSASLVSVSSLAVSSATVRLRQATCSSVLPLLQSAASCRPRVKRPSGAERRKTDEETEAHSHLGSSFRILPQAGRKVRLDAKARRVSLTSGACRGHAIVKLRRTFHSYLKDYKEIMMAARPDRTEAQRPARASGLHLARHFRRSPVRSGRHVALAWRLGIPRPYGSGERLGTDLARTSRPGAPHRAPAAALPARAAALRQAADGRLHAALVRLVPAHGLRQAVRLVERGAGAERARLQCCFASASGSPGRC